MQVLYPVFCRGHSGGRLVCEAYSRNGIRMGNVTDNRKDTKFFSLRSNPMIREIILNAYDYLNGEAALKNRLQQLMQQAVSPFWETEIGQNGPFGWKLGSTIFAMQVVLDAFPAAKVLHVVRDGRDVMLSRLPSRVEHLDDPANRLMMFGEANVETFEGRPLAPETIKEFRNELEMQHWVTAVEYGLLGKKYGGRYLEARYEKICAEPIAAFQKIFDFIGVPFLAETKAWLKGAVSMSSIGKWKALPAEALVRPLQIGGRLLNFLGYASP